MIPIEILKIKDELRHGIHILCRLHINNKEFRMLIDTGSSMTIFNINKSNELSNNELENNEQQIKTIGNNNVVSKYVVIDEMRLGDIILKDYKTILIDLEHMNEHFRSNGYPLIDGIIGGDILYSYGAIIDYDKREMILKNNI